MDEVYTLSTARPFRSVFYTSEGGVVAYTPIHENDILCPEKEFIMSDTRLEILLRKNDVTTIRKQVEFNLSSQDEDLAILAAASGWREVDITNIVNNRTFIIYTIDANVSFDVRLTYDQEQITVTAFDDAVDNGLYIEAGVVNGKNKYSLESNGYIQWSASNLRWEKFKDGDVLHAYTDNAANVEDGIWSRVSNPSLAYDVVVVRFDTQPIIIKCKDFFCFGPQDDTFMATLSKIEISTPSSTSVKVFAGSLGAT